MFGLAIASKSSMEFRVCWQRGLRRLCAVRPHTLQVADRLRRKKEPRPRVCGAVVYKSKLSIEACNLIIYGAASEAGHAGQFDAVYEYINDFTHNDCAKACALHIPLNTKPFELQAGKMTIVAPKFQNVLLR